MTGEEHALPKWVGKMPSGLTLAGLVGIAALGIWNGAKLQDQVVATTEIVKIQQVQLDTMAKLVDQNSRRIDSLSYRASTSDERSTAVTSSIALLATELRAFKDQEELFNRQLITNMAEQKTILRGRVGSADAPAGVAPK